MARRLAGQGPIECEENASSAALSGALSFSGLRLVGRGLKVAVMSDKMKAHVDDGVAHQVCN